MTSGCIEHRGHITSGGYGQVKLSVGIHVQAHRLAYMAVHGAIPAGMVICHRCDNPRCVNPDHLFLGTHKDNAEDMVAKGRSLVGERNPKARLTEEIVTAMRSEYSDGKSARELADRFGLTVNYAERVIGGHSWRHLPRARKKAGGWKLTPSKVVEIRQQVASGVRQSVVASRFDVSRATVSRVVNGKTFAGVGVP